MTEHTNERTTVISMKSILRFFSISLILTALLSPSLLPAQPDENQGTDGEQTDSGDADGQQEEKEGLRFTGLPLPSYNDDIGFTYGLCGYATYYEAGYEPYRAQVWAQYLASTKGYEDHAASLDMLDFLGTGLRWKFQAGFSRTLLAQYYGFGNQQDIQYIDKVQRGEVPVGENIPTSRTILPGYELAEEFDIIAPKFADEFNLNQAFLYDPVGNFQNESALNPGRRILRERQNRYYNYDRIRPYFQASTENFIGDTNFKWFVGVRLQRYKIQSYAGDRDGSEAEYNSLTLVDIEQPSGYDAIAEGARRFVNGGRVALAYDSRPRARELNPNEGIFTDVHYEGVGKGTGSHYSFQRVTFTWRQYIELLHDFFNPYDMEMVFAYRLLAQETFGDVPFFEAGRIYNMREDSEGLGGSGGLRGYPSNQFVDRFMTMGNFELRTTFARTGFLGGMDFQLMAFYDIGRVAPSKDEWTLHGMHKAWGPGISMVWQRNTIVTIFAGSSQYSSFTAFKLSHMF
ncbi:MAG: hypothetical protein KDK27_05390 [Leptospiraceae bacterium]|nr:hypothetical protein [Leptospiraceae bacterium]